MNLRITAETNKRPAVVRIDGELLSEGLSELKKVCENLPEPLLLDLTDLIRADPEALQALRDLIDRGAAVKGASPYIQLLLEPAQGE